MDNTTVVPRSLPYHLLEEMTNGFSEERLLGSGTYGKVYLGLRKDGKKIAVKMLRYMPGLDDEQFEKEYHNLESLQHQNIVRFVGYCNETRREFLPYNGKKVLADTTYRVLCFEYMHKGLDKYLSDESNGHDWRTRYAITKGICMGLKYLHEELKPPMFHLDLKPANVLLTENMVPKIADFGISRLFGGERTLITTSPIGTTGYIPPEFIRRNIISNKFDVFSLGVVIINIVAGPEGYSRSADMSSQDFTEQVHENWRNKLQATSMDGLESYCKQVKRCIEIALRCVEEDRHKRPTIGDIVNELNETETMIHELTQSPNALRNDTRSTMDKESSRETWQIHTTVTEGKHEKKEGGSETEKSGTAHQAARPENAQESRQTHFTRTVEEKQGRDIENCFGEVVDDYKLDKIAKYMGKPKTQEDRAREAWNLVNEDDKDAKASRYVEDLKAIYGNGQSTLCLVYNATGDKLRHVAHYDWYGHIGDRAPYPAEIGNGQWAAFHHVHQTGDPSGSVAAVVYRGKNRDGQDRDYLVAWSTPWGVWYRNKAYCEIGSVGYFHIRWGDTYNKVINSDYSAHAKSDGCDVDAKIGTGDSPKFIARISSR